VKGLANVKIVQVLHILTRNYKLTIRISLGKHDVCSYSDHALLISDVITLHNLGDQQQVCQTNEMSAAEICRGYCRGLSVFCPKKSIMVQNLVPVLSWVCIITQPVHMVQAAIGGWHCLAVDDEGRAYAWGK
jgi:hypothetical protein